MRSWCKAHVINGELHHKAMNRNSAYRLAYTSIISVALNSFFGRDAVDAQDLPSDAPDPVIDPAGWASAIQGGHTVSNLAADVCVD